MGISQHVSFVLQPVMDTSCNISFFELLARCDDFDAVLEHHHLALLERSCAFAAAAAAELGLPITVNVEPASFNVAPVGVQTMLEHSGVWIEVTERGALTSQAMGALCSFARGGGVVWIDDLGTGESTFAERGALFDAGAVGGVKVDVEHLFIASQLALPVVCEHVETRSDLESAVTAGADYFQGFLFAEPMTLQTSLQFATRATATLG
jgi:EAL domain-containing protein (putative c-di-GMP-specific phosphodiesterase class I)